MANNLSTNARDGAISVGGHQISITQAPLPPCSYKISPVTRMHGPGAASNYVALTTSNYCSWSVVNTNPWVTILTSAGTGSANIGYLVGANPSTDERTGTLLVADQILTLVQSGVSCTSTISPTNRTHGYSPASNAVVLTTSGTNCAWTVVNTNTWIVTPVTNGTGSASISYLLATNASYTGRTGSVVISGQVLTVVQRGIGCPYDLSPASRSHGYSAVTNSVVISADNGCTWAVVNTNTWLTILSSASGAGNGTVTYAVTGNTNVASRTALVQIGDQLFTVIQGGIGCDVSLSPNSRNHGYGAATNSVSLTVNAGCPWTVVNTNDWVTITSAPSGSGNGMVSYTVAPNPAGISRSGVVVIGEQNFTIVQAAAPCNYFATPGSFTFESAGTNGAINLTTLAGCPWTLGNTNAWINFTTSSSGSGSAVALFTVLANSSATSRTGTVTLGSAVVTIIQAGQVPCFFKLSPNNRVHGAGAVSNSVSIATPNYCSWSVINSNNWITMVGTLNGLGSTNLGYLVAANTGLSERTGSVLIADQVLTLIQRAAACDYDLSPTNRNHGFGAATNTLTVSTSPGCSWMVVNTNSWVSILSGATGNNSGDITYSVDENVGLSERTGVVVVAGLPFTIVQKGASCAYSLSPSVRTHGYSGSTDSLTLSTASNCPWIITNLNSWITFTSGSNGVGASALNYTVAANSGVNARTGLVMIADQVFTVIQSGFNCTFKLSPTNRTHGFGMSTNTISVTASTNCTWNVVNPNHWLTINAGASGAGNGLVSYVINPNFTPLWRTGLVMVADQVLTISQKPVEEFAFDYIRLPGGQVNMRLSGGPSGAWNIESSADLVRWQKITTLTNTIGSVEYTETPPNGAGHFYRAVQSH